MVLNSYLKQPSRLVYKKLWSHRQAMQYLQGFQIKIILRQMIGEIHLIVPHIRNLNCWQNKKHGKSTRLTRIKLT
jgi:hypothetical protein